MDVSRETPDVTTKPKYCDLTNILVQVRLHLRSWQLWAARRSLGATASRAQHIIILVRGNWSTGFLDYILPRTPGGFRRLSEMSVITKQASCRYSWKNVFSRWLPYNFVENRSPYPILKCSLKNIVCTYNMYITSLNYLMNLIIMCIYIIWYIYIYIYTYIHVSLPRCLAASVPRCPPYISVCSV